MEIILDLFNLKTSTPDRPPHVAVIGNFDGVHEGHRHLIQTTVEKARQMGIPSAAITFYPHPLFVLPSTQSLKLLTSLSRKLELMAKLGLDRTLVLPFTRALATLTPEEFVLSVLTGGLNIKELVMGHDFVLGRSREGDAKFLQTLAEKWHFSISQVEPLFIDEELVSSSLIRKYIDEGLVDMVPPLLGRYHSVEGLVFHGEGRGSGLGFPTANMDCGEALLPYPGVYATWVELAPDEKPGRILPAVTNIGTNPTFGESTISVETHILDFSENIYGHSMRLSFAKFLRKERYFPDKGELCSQILQDIDQARGVLLNIKPPVPAGK